MDPYANYPKVIKNAILMALSSPALSALTPAYRRVLKIITSRVPKAAPCSPVEVEQSWLADMAECSTRTIYRAVTEFKAMGLIEQVGDGRDDTGLFTNPVYQLTATAAQLLGFPAKSFSNRKTFVSDDLIVELSLKEDHREIQEEKPENPIELPAELAALPEQLGIKDTGIAKLRGIAHAAGYQLQDVVACAAGYLAKGITGNRAFRYLESMLAKPNIDYAARAAQAGRAVAQADVESKAEAAAKRHAGKAYRDADGFTYRFRSDGRVEQLDGGAILGFVPVDQIEQLAAQMDAVLPQAPAAPQQAPQAPQARKVDVGGVVANLKALLRGGAPLTA